jgi:hypothetical protein
MFVSFLSSESDYSNQIDELSKILSRWVKYIYAKHKLKKQQTKAKKKLKCKQYFLVTTQNWANLTNQQLVDKSRRVVAIINV